MRRRSPLLALALAVLTIAAVAPAPKARAVTTWWFDTFRADGYLTQDPYYTACTGAAAMMMLNFVALSGAGGRGFIWRTSRTKNLASDPRDMISMYTFARGHDTLLSTSAGSDAHGWRNALNYFGWGEAAMTDPGLRMYEDRAFGSFDSAVRSAVIALARYRMPVGMLGRGGAHAQVITGYKVTGEDPAVSTNFDIVALYLADPLASSGLVDARVSIGSLRSGSIALRFRPYVEADSPHDDPYTGGVIASSVRVARSEWYGRYVLIVPVHAQLPLARRQQTLP